jgi:hypothetical protein
MLLIAFAADGRTDDPRVEEGSGTDKVGLFGIGRSYTLIGSRGDAS